MNTTQSYALHAEPMLIWPEELRSSSGSLGKFGPDGTLAQFLQDFGKTLLSKYKPRAVAVFSAHWETHDQTLGAYLPGLSLSHIQFNVQPVTDYGEENPLYMDFYGFPPAVRRTGRFELDGLSNYLLSYHSSTVCHSSRRETLLYQRRSSKR